MKTLTLGWDHGLLAFDSFGGRLGPVLFLLPDGRQVAPFFVAPWFSEPQDFAQPPLLHRLRGEWPCVPFGFDRDRPAVFDWPASSEGRAIDVGHGYAASHEWEVLETSDSHLRLAVAYPDGHPIARLERTIRPVPDRPAIDLQLAIEARTDCLLPIGLHPTFAGQWFIDLAPQATVATFPYRPSPLSNMEPGRFAQIGAVPTTEGGIVDARCFPPPAFTEELLQALDIDGHVGLINDSEKYRLDLSWEAEHFPSLLLWISHKALTEPPWNGRISALGVEPVCSAFDLGTGVSGQDNPISRRGVRTARQFRAGENFSTTYRIAAAPLA